MLKNFKLLGAVAVAGVVAVTGSAFTAGGFSTATATGGFVGGTAAQNITGATLVSSKYAVTANEIDSVTLVFGEDSTNGRTPTITFSGGTGVTGTAYTCSAVAAKTTTCSAGTTKAASTVGSLSITVPS